MTRAQGFAGERISVLPRPLIHQALGRPLTGRLLVTDCGHFPAAAGHRRSRPSGSGQAIVIVCAEGRGWCDLPAGRRAVHPGQALVLPPGVPHTYGAADGDPWTIWWLHLAGSDVRELLAAARVDAERPVVGVGDVYRAVALIDESLRRMQGDDSAASMQAAAGAAWHLLALLAADRTGTTSGGHDPVRQAREYLHDHVGTRVGVAELAALARLSPSHFAALFRKATGVGVLKYQTRLRMSRARELLDTTDLPIATIARRLGYQDPFYFSRQFHAAHGVPASTYRAQHKG
ncbi:helix-turn-helix domain-containing protein [Actinomadura scrupuli]|uniref:helix-turn-helix domain-containing protein n=1 Tax=Actinomadura scrupuli TaxID=559629 RepID=UPI003D975FEB